MHPLHVSLSQSIHNNGAKKISLLAPKKNYFIYFFDLFYNTPNIKNSIF